MKILWHRLSESSEARLSRMRRFGYLRFCALYAVIFPLAHVVAATVRAALIGNTLELGRLPVEIAGWAAAGALVASAFWLAGTLREKLRTEPSRRATPESIDR